MIRSFIAKLLTSDEIIRFTNAVDRFGFVIESAQWCCLSATRISDH